MVGIYKITSPSGRVYIGQSWNIEKRFRCYKYLNCKKQIKLYSSFKKYGVNNHIFEIIHVFLFSADQDILDKYELFFIEEHIKEGNKILNLRYGGCGGRCSEETKKRISEQRIKKFAKRITQFYKNGKFIKTWDSIPEAAKELKIGNNRIAINLKNNKGRCGEFIFKEGWLNKDLIISKESKKNKKIIKKHKEKKKRERHKYPLFQYDLKENFIKEWASATVVSEEFGLKLGYLNIIARLGNIPLGGFIWKRNKIIKN